VIGRLLHRARRARGILEARALGGSVVLLYHRVAEPNDGGRGDPFSLCVSPARFAEHLEVLRGFLGRPSLPLEALVDGGVAVGAGRRGARSTRGVAITFDDGYADNLPAARTLARHGASATFYITAGCLADGQPFWPVELRHLLRRVPEPRLTLHAGDVQVDLDLDTEEARAVAVRRLTTIFKSHPIPVRDALREELRNRAGSPAVPRVMLDWDEVREMHALGMTIGSHTMTHPNLPSAGIEAARDELVTSKRRLEEEIGAPVTMFSYPNGGAERYLTPAVQQAVRDAGYTAATTSRNAFAGPGSDLFALERVEVEERLEDLVFALEVERFAFRPSARPSEERVRG
jgi:peptidoglycan/xylan/chitin deacetylase (PgdA/CDA1 family)